MKQLDPKRPAKPRRLRLNNKLAIIGETAVCALLKKHGHNILARNYLEKCGEIDIVSELGGILHFIEVKSVSRESIYKKQAYVTHVTSVTDKHIISNKISSTKQMRFKRVVALYLAKHHKENTPFTIDFALVFVAPDRYCKVKYLENVVI